MNDPTLHSQVASTERTAALNQAKEAAHEAYLAACRALTMLDETAADTWIDHAKTARQSAWDLYVALVLETEW